MTEKLTQVLDSIMVILVKIDERLSKVEYKPGRISVPFREQVSPLAEDIAYTKALIGKHFGACQKEQGIRNHNRVEAIKCANPYNFPQGPLCRCAKHRSSDL